MTAPAEGPTKFFWKVASDALRLDGVQTGTMMGFPCLRADGAFFASCDHRTGELIVKLPQARVQELIGTGDGIPFAPAGREFREWVRVAVRDASKWAMLIAEAHAFAASRPDRTAPS
jgi:hypothetical protein